MPETRTETEVERHHLCRNLVWETSPDGRTVPGRYCANRLGVVQLLDCPVFQGVECCLFDPRADGEDPSAVEEEDLERIRTRLARDYLRWPYWRRIETLRGSEAPPGEVEDFPDVIEAGAEAAEDIEETPVAEARAEAPAPPTTRVPPADEALRERYPGQRRSEEERRSRRPEEEEAPRALDEGFVAGIFDEAPEAGAAREPPAQPAEESAGESRDEPEKAPEKKRRRRRGRPRRRRGRGRGKPKAE